MKLFYQTTTKKCTPHSPYFWNKIFSFGLSVISRFILPVTPWLWITVYDGQAASYAIFFKSWGENSAYLGFACDEIPVVHKLLPTVLCIYRNNLACGMCMDAYLTAWSKKMLSACCLPVTKGHNWHIDYNQNSCHNAIMTQGGIESMGSLSSTSMV